MRLESDKSFDLSKGELGLSTMNEKGQVLVANNYLDERVLSNQIISRQFDTARGHFETDSSNACIWDMNADDYVQDLKWIDGNHFVYSSGSLLHLGQTADDGAFIAKVSFSTLHANLIREIDVNPVDPNVVVSAGYDGDVVVSDLFRLVDHVEHPGNSVVVIYSCKQVISSVLWHPLQPNLCSCTSEFGFFHMFDTRVKIKKSSVLVHDAERYDLLSHCVINDYSVQLGFGSSLLRSIDLRKPLQKGNEVVVTNEDVMGNLQYDPISETLVASGVSFINIFDVSDGGMSLKPSGVILGGARNVIFLPGVQGRILMVCQDGCMNSFNLLSHIHSNRINSSV